MNKTVTAFSEPQQSNINVGETVGPQKGLTHRDVLSCPEMEKMTPSFFVYEKNTVKQITISSEQSIFKIGRNKTCDICIDDNTISDYQLSVVRIGRLCYFMDCGT